MREHSPTSISQPFIVAYGCMDCAFCDKELDEGSEAGYIDGEIVCGDCLHAERAKETKKFTKKWRER